LPYQFTGAANFLADELATLNSPGNLLKSVLYRIVWPGLAKILEAGQTGAVDYGIANFWVRP
jgi:hypothetical protein